MEGKEVRFGIVASSLFAVITTSASCGAVNAMHDSFTALGGMIPLINIQLGELIVGGVDAGSYGMLTFVAIWLFVLSAMVSTSRARKSSIPPSAGTLPTTGGLFVGLVVGVVLIIGGLTFFPALALGPIVEQLASNAGTLF